MNTLISRHNTIWAAIWITVFAAIWQAGTNEHQRILQERTHKHIYTCAQLFVLSEQHFAQSTTLRAQRETCQATQQQGEMFAYSQAKNAPLPFTTNN